MHLKYSVFNESHRHEQTDETVGDEDKDRVQERDRSPSDKGYGCEESRELKAE
jgi:hypothetical protein